MDLKKLYPKRRPWSHKGQHGSVLIVAGSNHFSGTPVFNALAALRSGADLARIVGPKRAMDIAANGHPDLITYPLAGELSVKNMRLIFELAKISTAVIIGGGLHRSQTTHAAIRKIISSLSLPMVVDAEAIHAIAETPKIIANKAIIVTPHAQEFQILTGLSVADNLKDRQRKTLMAAKKLQTTILLKGKIDIIADSHSCTLNRTGSVYMTKGGFGDCLAGVAGALLARGHAPRVAADAAAYITGKAGELAAKKFGEGILASDLFEYLPSVIKQN